MQKPEHPYGPLRLFGLINDIGGFGAGLEDPLQGVEDQRMIVAGLEVDLLLADLGFEDFVKPSGFLVVAQGLGDQDHQDHTKL